MEIYCQFISIYGKFVTSQTASFSRADTSTRLNHFYFQVQRPLSPVGALSPDFELTTEGMFINKVTVLVIYVCCDKRKHLVAINYHYNYVLPYLFIMFIAN